MMTVLSLSTSSSLCSIGVWRDGELVAERTFPPEMRLLERLMPCIAETLREPSLELTDLDRIAVDVGPGSFTGVRIGVMTAKALAWAARIPVVGVTSLESIAECVPSAETSLLFALIKARPACVYFQCFHQSEGHWVPLTPPEMVAIADLRVRAHATGSDSRCAVVTADLSEQDRRHVETALLGADSACGRVSDALPTAECVYRRAERLLLQVQAQDPLALTPCYVASPNIGKPRTAR